MIIDGTRIESSIHCVKPRMQLAKNVPVTDEFRAGFNAWMRDFFGVEPTMYLFNPQAIGVTGAQMIVAHPSLIAKLKDTTK